MAAREVHVTFINKTQSYLSLFEISLAHGTWIEQPTDIIAPGQTVTWRSDSDGIMTGTEGRAYYQTHEGVAIELWWDNPYLGYDKNGIYFDGQESYCNDYYGSYYTEGGNREYVIFVICEFAANWMEKYWYNSDRDYRNTPLCDLMLPGSHDSGSFFISAASGMSPDASEVLKLLARVDASLVARWAKTQNFNIKQQLDAGIRYFDIRIAQNNHNEFYISHGMYSIRIELLLDAVANFTISHPYEIIIIDINHFYQMDLPAHHKLAEIINKKLADRLADNNLGVKVTPQVLWDKGYQVIINYADDSANRDSDFFADRSFLWRRSVRSYWPDTSDLANLKLALEKELLRKPAQQFWVMQCILTIQPSDYAWIVEHAALHTYPYSLIEWSSMTNEHMLSIVSSPEWQKMKVNIVIFDAFECSRGFIDAIISRYY